MINHELGNVLPTLRRTIDQLAQEVHAEDRRISRLRAQVDQLDHLGGSLRGLAPDGDEAWTRFDLLDLLYDALQETRAERNGHLGVELEVSGQQLHGPRLRMQLVFTNLIRNAAQAAAARPARLRISSRRGAGELTLVFEDDGPGVPEHLRPRLFERGSSGRGGTGLGLALVREIVEPELGGRVTFEPSPGGGARFVLILPLPEEQAVAHVLIVDDFAPFVETVTEDLEQAGYTVAWARSAEELEGRITAEEEEHPHVVLLDVRLEGPQRQEVDGITLVSRVLARWPAGRRGPPVGRGGAEGAGVGA